jgi:hypothetical protein
MTRSQTEPWNARGIKIVAGSQACQARRRLTRDRKRGNYCPDAVSTLLQARCFRGGTRVVAPVQRHG